MLFVWSPEALATLQRLYATTALSAEAIAEQIGSGCTAYRVRKKASLKGYTRQRPAAFVRARRRELLDAVRPAANAARLALLATRPAKPRPEPAFTRRPLTSPVVALDERALIDAAIAAGMVRVVPAGTAAGLTAVERMFHAARPPVQDMRAVIHQGHLARKAAQKRAASAAAGRAS